MMKGKKPQSVQSKSKIKNSSAKQVKKELIVIPPKKPSKNKDLLKKKSIS